MRGFRQGGCLIRAVPAVLFVLAVALIPCPAAHAGESTDGVTASTSTQPPQLTGIPAVALSYHGQYLATITRQHGEAVLALSDIDGSHRHTIALAGGCEPDAIRWAPNWNVLAVLTRCAAKSNKTHASGALWVLDVQDGKPARKLAGFDGTASQLQWRSDGKVVAFLFTPETLGARHASPASVIMAVPTSGGGSPQVASPKGLDVHEFRLARDVDLLAYTATPVASPSALPELYAVAYGKTRLVYDPATDAPRGLRVSSPRWSSDGGAPSPLFFLGESATDPGATGADLYLHLRNSNSPLVNLTGAQQRKPEWFSPIFTHALATRVVGDSTLVMRYVAFDTGAGLRHEALLCTIPGVITDGHGPGSLAMGSGPVAYFEYPASGGPAVLRVGGRNWLRTGCKPRWTINPESLAMSGAPRS